MIDWTKPLELMDGTPVRLLNFGLAGPSPEDDGSYWVIDSDGVKSRFFKDVVDTYIRNRDETAEVVLNEWARLEGEEKARKDTSTLRDQFAMAALTGLLMNTGDADPHEVWAIADAILAERSK